MEILDIVDNEGRPTGKTASRAEVHSLGLMHRTAHVWIYRLHEGRFQILLQKRSLNKDSFPGCYDISSAGHIPAGEDYIPSALRELGEELGISAEAEELIYRGHRYIEYDDVFHGEEFHDRQYTRVYLLSRNEDESFFTPQPEEIESVMWMDYDECLDKLDDADFPNCILADELKMLR